MPAGDEGPDELPKVHRVRSTQSIASPNTLQMLSEFLMDEQERRQSLRETHHLGTTWKDLQNAYETVAAFEDPGIAAGGYDTFEGPQGGADVGSSAFSDVQKIAMRASQMLSPESLKKKKERKKKRKDKKEKKEAKKHAKLQAKMMMGQEGSRRF
ncbi:expressed unknown protein [Seminavis robusta]|uniref:Uncharacterized protein n=1 Tax=Seminavis robusta TaxID=568900 RepID=A0A9N8DNC1_9STRA|nr:expressed unknown protein [Seminavis robusta]|eukprot:Sro233_g094090.1 n/a (155) ;mRNA; f:2887-3351